jgi:hypothetical protein
MAARSLPSAPFKVQGWTGAGRPSGFDGRRQPAPDVFGFEQRHRMSNIAVSAAATPASAKILNSPALLAQSAKNG